ncbi:methyltransferase domain-containing protein [Paenibacillus sp. LMG 31456]|uniref:Methyltransferase domain-containing protein n=1 Tax=Paenibacillus foliorum TaxID=2654974 RepID=A0A972GV78_9BACL|nr:methyltransferase domain-containing protein [Paenibacillus foliorum]NOU96770.1 methyltransferase domain-containing protein [Paenibacillus foliorum]
MKREDFLTTGQIARRTGITIRALRYYDQIGLLNPSHCNDASLRMYSKEDLIRLQKIQALKYVGLSLNEIKQIIQDNSLPLHDLRSSLVMQKDIIQQKIAHMQFVVKAINESMSILSDKQEQVDWESLGDLIQAVNVEKDWIEQYYNACRLQKRMQLYDKFSVNKIGWHRWLFEHLSHLPNLRVLELGCGDAALWSRNIERVPESWSITLTDLSSGMLDEARKNLGEHSNRFKFLVVDVQAIPYHNNEFDIVIANHMLYHVPDISKAIVEIHRVLKHDGMFYASTMSKRHLQEIEHLVQSFDSQIQVLDHVMERFHLDNGEEILSPWFSEINCIQYEDHMLVDEIQPLINYITSTPMNAREILKGATLDKFIKYISAKLEVVGSIYITKDSGFFLGRK